jgi:hypothetical protein
MDKYLLLDIDRARISAEALSGLPEALLVASNVGATHVLQVDELLLTADHFVNKLHDCASKSEVWELLSTTLHGQVTAHTVGGHVEAAIRPTRGVYPKNITARARPVWDEIVASQRYKQAIMGKDGVAAFAVAVKWLNEACRRRAITPFNDGDAGGKPDPDLRARMLREMRVCKSYVEQVFRNLSSLNMVTRQLNWSNTAIALRGNLYELKSTKRIRVKAASLTRIKSILKKYEGFNGEDLLARPTPNGFVLFGVVPEQSELRVSLSLQYTRAQLVASLGLDPRSTGAELLEAARKQLGQSLLESMRSVVAGVEVDADIESDSAQREKAAQIADLILDGIATKKVKLRANAVGELVSSVTHTRLLGSKAVFLVFENADPGTVAGGFIRSSRTSIPKIRIRCSFQEYGLPDSLNRWRSTDLQSTLEHECIHLLDFRRTNGRDLPGYERALNGGDAKYFNTPAELNAYAQAMINEFARVASADDFVLPFDKFYARFKSSFKAGTRNADFLANIEAHHERRFINRVYAWWQANQPITAAVKQLRALEDFDAESIDGADTVKIPAGAVLLPANDEDTVNCFQIAHPPECFGKRVRFGPEQHQKCAHIDNDIETFDGSMDAAFELLVEEFSNLPTVRQGINRIIKVLGPVTTWKYAGNRSWLHNMNMKVTHPSLSFEIIEYQGVKSLAAIYIGDWS